MFYRLYWNGSLYSNEKFESLDEAKKAAEEANACFSNQFGCVYVYDKFKRQVA